MKNPQMEKQIDAERKSEARLMAFALGKELEAQQKQIAFQKQFETVVNKVHSTYPICGGVSDFSKKDRFAYCKADLYPKQ